MKWEIRRFFHCYLLALLALPLVSQAQSPDYVRSSPREFVERFYKWYVPLAQDDQISRSWEVTLKLAPPPFSPELTKLLRGDLRAQASCKELVGLDFDPFLYTQDPAQAYAVGEISRAGKDYEAGIYGIDHGVQSTEPSVIAEFTKKEGRWFFVNFHYLSPKGDLFAVLEARPPCAEPRIPGGR